jgi:hypothetical protein
MSDYRFVHSTFGQTPSAALPLHNGKWLLRLTRRRSNKREFGGQDGSNLSLQKTPSESRKAATTGRQTIQTDLRTIFPGSDAQEVGRDTKAQFSVKFRASRAPVRAS